MYTIGYLGMSKTPHFFKVRSRLGLPFPPLHSMDLHSGVACGADAILGKEFLELFPEYEVTTYDFPGPSETKEVGDEFLATTLHACAEDIGRCVSEKMVQVVLGGDHSITFPSFLSVLRRHTDWRRVGYVQFDSHADMNLKRTSPTGNFHGMYVRAFLDKEFDIPSFQDYLEEEFPSSNMLFVGNLDLDEEEGEFFLIRHIKHISKEMLVNAQKESNETFRHFISQFEHLHVSFDIDSLDARLAPATGIPSQDGLFLDDIMDMLQMVAQHPSFSFDLAEVDPTKPGAEKTIAVARGVLKTVLLPLL